MLIDTHTHIETTDENAIKTIIRESSDNNVKKLIVSLCTREDIARLLPVLQEYEEIFLTLGYHPEEASKLTEEDLSILKKALATSKVVGVGEIGLDYFYTKENKEQQKEWFEKQLSLAEELSLPVVIHSREATLDTIEILKKHHVKGVIHCFSGSYETATDYTKMGFLLGIGGVVTFKNSHLGEVVQKIDLSHLVLETDSPYLSPVPYRGKPNASKNIPIIAEKVAQIKKVSPATVEKITSENASNLFSLSLHERKDNTKK